MNKKEKSKIKLVKKSFTGELYDSNIILSQIPLIHRTWINEDKIGDFGPLLDRLEEHLTLKQLRLVYRNLTRVKLKKFNMINSLHLNGYYDVVKSEFFYKNNCVKCHEFLHLASSFHDFINNISYSGLSQWDSKGRIGIGLDEGYTELLNERFFSDTFYVDAYIDEVNIVRMLELFFDDYKDMMNYYFECDLPGFIRYFERFISREEFIKLLLEIDKFSFCAMYDLPFCNSQLVNIYIKIYNLFLSTNPSFEKIKRMEQIIHDEEDIGILFEKKQRKLIKKEMVKH